MNDTVTINTPKSRGANDWFFTGEVELKNSDEEEHKKVISALLRSMAKKLKTDAESATGYTDLDNLAWTVFIAVKPKEYVKPQEDA